MLGLLRLQCQALFEQFGCPVQVTFVHRYPAEQANCGGMVRLQRQCLVQKLPATMPGLHPLQVTALGVIGLAVGRIGLQHQPRHLGLL